VTTGTTGEGGKNASRLLRDDGVFGWIRRYEGGQWGVRNLIRGDAAHPLHSTHVAARGAVVDDDPDQNQSQTSLPNQQGGGLYHGPVSLMGQRRLKRLLMGHPNGFM
jgi:hypothetical protein